MKKVIIIFFIAVVLMLLAYFFYRSKTKKTPMNTGANKIGNSLAEANNNPLNIRDTVIPWHGTIGQNKGFEVFDTLENGARAGLKNTINKSLLHGEKSIRQIIEVLSPPNENDTEAYISKVVSDMRSNGYSMITDSFQPTAKNDWVEMVYSMHKIEAGYSWIPKNIWGAQYDTI